MAKILITLLLLVLRILIEYRTDREIDRKKSLEIAAEIIIL